MCRKLLVFFLLFIQSFALFSQDTLKYTRQQSEAIFLKENLVLLAEKLNIPKAQAAVQQAKLWPNPTLTFDQVNLWATQAQTGGQQTAPPLWNGFGKNQQFALEIEQLIETAGKRKKLLALEQVSVDKAEQYFNDVLRNLKTEFRRQLTDLQYTQLQQAILNQQLISIQQITNSYEKQVQQGNLSKNQLVRLRAQMLEITQDVNNWKMQNYELQSSLKTLMHLPPSYILVVEDDDFDSLKKEHELLNINDLLLKAKNMRPDFQLAKLDVIYNDKLYQYEKAKSIPDLYLKGNYDRNGSTMLNFVGFGVAIDLPIFNRNQGNIKIAELGMQQSMLQSENAERIVENELVKVYQNYLTAIDFRKQIDTNYIQDLDEILNAYTRNFKQQNISIVEYIDFLEAYLENRKSILEAAKTVKNTAEELNYTVGTDIINP